MPKSRPHPFSHIFVKGCGLFFCSINRFCGQWDDAGIGPNECVIHSLVINNPFLWIVFDILPYFIIILLITNQVVIITRLPNVATIFFVAKAFERTDKLCKRWGPLCRDTPPGVSVSVLCGFLLVYHTKRKEKRRSFLKYVDISGWVWYHNYAKLTE